MILVRPFTILRPNFHSTCVSGNTDDKLNVTNAGINSYGSAD